MKLRTSQMELALQLVKGYTLKEIAINLNSNYDSIRKRTRSLYKKFRVTERNNLAAALIEEKIITTMQVSERFRKRFTYKKLKSYEVQSPTKELTEQELKYLRLVLDGNTKSNIIKKMNLYNMHYCNYIQACICRKLNARNITNALFIVGKLGMDIPQFS